MKDILNQLLENNSLTFEQAKSAMEIMASGEASIEHMAFLLGALRMKGESIDEISGFAHVLRERAMPIDVKRDDLIDTCGTGGDKSGSFNISTTVAFVTAGSGLGVAKHGNRSVSSKSGSIDVLEALGIKVTQKSTDDVAKDIEENGFGVLFAPMYHPAFMEIGPVRKALGVRSVFNILGPLVNPAKVKKQVLGVFDKNYIEIMANVLKNLGSTDAIVVASVDGMDEFSVSALSNVAHLKDGKISSYQVDPREYGIEFTNINDLQGGDAFVNAAIIDGVLKGEKHGACRDVVVLNSAAALLVGGKVENLKDGVIMAANIIDDGLAYAVLEKARA
jgi:anthranilate phosphoribosyltransferase